MRWLKRCRDGGEALTILLEEGDGISVFVSPEDVEAMPSWDIAGLLFSWRNQAYDQGAREGEEKATHDFHQGVIVDSVEDIRTSEFAKADADAAFGSSGLPETMREEWQEEYILGYSPSYYDIYQTLQAGERGQSQQ